MPGGVAGGVDVVGGEVGVHRAHHGQRRTHRDAVQQLVPASRLSGGIYRTQILETPK